MILGMPVDTISSEDLESAIASLRAGGSLAMAGEALLLLPNWRDEDWKQLFRFTSIRGVKAGDALIRHGEPDRTLYIVLHGELEVIVHSIDGLSMGRVALVGAGSVLGELAFFDGGPRSAGAWAVDDSEVAAITPDQYTAFEKTSPALARELLFALGRILAIRLRRTNAKVLG
jgi:CRP-like cAMP-binding protein